MAGNFPYPTLAEMPLGNFWVRSAEYLPTLSREDVDLARDRDPAQLPPEVQERVSAAARTALDRLISAEVGQPYCGKPS